MSTRGPGHPLDDTPRDAALAQAYRDAVATNAAAGEPPAALDDAIRAAARRAVHAKPRDAAQPQGGGWFGRRWQMSMALAASMVLAVGVAIKVYDTGEADIRAERPTVAAKKSAAQVPPSLAQDRQAEPRAAEAVAEAGANAVGQSAATHSGASASVSPRVDIPVVPPAGVPAAPASAPPKGAPPPAPPPTKADRSSERAATRDAEDQRADAKRSAAPVQAPKAPPMGDRAGTPASEAKAFPADQPRPSVRTEQSDAAAPAKPSADPAVAGTPAPAAQSERPDPAPATASTSSVSKVAPAAPQAAPSSPPPAPVAPSPERRAAPAEATSSTERTEPSARLMRERAAMKVEQAQGASGAASGPGLGAGAGAGISGRMQSGAGPAAAPRPLIATAKQLESRPAEDWIASIRELKRVGRAAEADELLVEFRKKFPDFALPDDLR